MRIIQMLPTLAFGDAIGNTTVTLHETLKKNGYQAEIYAEVVDSRLPEGTAKEIKYYEEKPDDIILYHLSTGSDLNYKISQYQCRFIIQYHNITPPEFFAPYAKTPEKLCADGLRAAKYLSKKAEFCFADSEFNKQDLINMGYTCPIEVLPILIAFEDFKKKPSKKVLDLYDDDWTNIVFTGRVAPNKKHEDLIAAFTYYKTYINPKSRLIMVGSVTPGDAYFAQLERYLRELGVEDYHFTGHIKFDEILAYYHLADVFLCLSDHEGFCVPLVESMYFNVPVVAYDSCAVGETLGGCGLLLDDKSPEVVAYAIDRVVKDKKLRAQMIACEQERLKHFEHERIKNQFLNAIERFVKGDNA